MNERERERDRERKRASKQCRETKEKIIKRTEKESFPIWIWYQRYRYLSVFYLPWDIVWFPLCRCLTPVRCCTCTRVPRGTAWSPCDCLAGPGFATPYFSPSNITSQRPCFTIHSSSSTQYGKLTVKISF